MFRFRTLFLLLLPLVICWSGPAGAAVPTMQLDDLVDGSEAIVYGRVVAVVPHWDGARERILTTVTVQPFDYMKGDLGSEPIVFEMPGGVVDDLRLVVSDTPEFEVGEEVVVFLREEFFRVVGWFQGKYSVKDGLVIGMDMSLTQFGERVIELAGESPSGAPGPDGTTVRRAEFTAPTPAGGYDQSTPEPKYPTGSGAPMADVTILSDDFEGPFPGSWTLIDQYATGHEWGKETYRVHGGSYSIWHCAGGANALPSGSDYPNSMRTWTLYGPFDLSDATTAEMTFWMSVQTASSNDYLFWGGSSDGSSYSGYVASGGTGAWTETTFDLTSWLGLGNVWIAFMFESDASGTSKGAFVDDVTITKTVVSGPTSTIDSITPNVGPAGTGSGFLVTITGSNFGATQAGGAVRFTRNPYSPSYVYSDYIDSWSDTQIVCNVPEGASSGLVTVTIGGAPGVGKTFNVTYSASSSSWAYMTEPMGEDIRINPSNSDVPEAEAQHAVVKGMQEWNDQGGAEFSFSYSGETGTCNATYDGLNHICFGTTGGSLATTYSWFSGPNQLENDMIFNDTGFTFSTDLSGGTYDIQAIAAHELGHFLRLLDMYGSADQGKTMYGYIGAASAGPRTIETEDQDGIQFFYGPESVNIVSRAMPEASLGDPYNQAIVAVGGTPPYTYALRSGTSTPPGLALATDGTISGTPTTLGTFFFTVRAVDDAADRDSQVLALTVGVGDSCFAPVLASPANGATCVNTDVTLDWTDVGGALGYEVQIGESCGSGTVYSTTNSEQLVSGLAYDTEHHWRARAECSSGWGPWTDCRTFTTEHAPLGPPTLTSPANGETDVSTTALLVWDCVPGAISYEIQVGSACGLGTIYASTSCSRAIPGLDLDTEYCWRVRAIDDCITYGEWSDCWCFTTIPPGPAPNSNGKWALHYAGPHNAKANTCSFSVTDCEDVIVNGPGAPGRYDIYVIAVDVDAVAGTRYGLTCDGTFYFYGWTPCSDLEIPTAGWPQCDEGNAQTWFAEQPGPHVTVGILDVYVYGTSSLSTAPDPRKGFAEWCDGTAPDPLCFQTTDPNCFSTVGFGVPGVIYCEPPVPVGLSGFEAKATDEGILLEWTAADVANFSHFFVRRSAIASDGDYLRLDEKPIEAGGTLDRDYSYLDKDVIPGTLYYYKLEAIEPGGESVFFGPYPVMATEKKARYSLAQNIPNPFSRGSETTISYSVAEGGMVQIRILDVAGRLVRTIREEARPGENRVIWDGTDQGGRQVASGVYFYEIKAGGFSAEKKMLLVD